MIIDSHLHCKFEGLDKAEIKKSCKQILSEFKKYGIQKSCIMSSGFYESFYHNADAQTSIAEYLVMITEMFPDKFYPLLTLNALLPSEFLIKTLDKYIVKGPLIGVKLTIQMNARDSRLDEICRFMEKHDIPVLWHSWYKSTCKFQFESDPSDIAYFAKKFPRLRVLMAHMTGCERRGIQDIKNCPNVVVDTSGAQPYDGYLEYTLKNLGPDRVLYGSDYPCRDIPVQMGRIQSVDLTPKVKEKVLYSNALKFFTKKGN